MSSATMPVNIRLSKSEQQKYEAQAASYELPLRTYLKQKLEYNDKLLEEMTDLRSAVSQVTELLNHEQKESAMMLEILLLLRQLVQPRQIQLAQGELKRLGLKPWTSSDTQGHL